MNSGSADSTRNLNAPSGWGGSSYTGTRAAGPFAILDVAYTSVQTLVAADAAINMPAMQFFWSINNRPAQGNVSDGDIGTSLFTIVGGVPTVMILGAADTDTDEYDTHVVAHEFGHYFENSLSRSDSIGGSHGSGDRLDMRVAMGEGFGYAFAGIMMQDPNARDSSGAGQSTGFNIDVEENNTTNPGWFSEASVQSIIYDIYDSAVDSNDVIAAGFQPIYDTLTSAAYKNNDQMMSIYPFIDIIKNEAACFHQLISPLD